MGPAGANVRARRVERGDPEKQESGIRVIGSEESNGIFRRDALGTCFASQASRCMIHLKSGLAEADIKTARAALLATLT